MIRKRERPRLLPAGLLVKTGPVDHADWNYRPLLGRIQRVRFDLVCRLLGERRHDRLLEVGYGSGVFLPELATRCELLHGIDLHGNHTAVEQALVRVGVRADLVSGSVTALPYPDAHFGAVVVVSALEYVEDIDAGCAELSRVLRPDGELVLVTPGQSPLVDAGLRLLTGESAGENYAGRRERLRGALQRWFRVLEQRDFPFLGGPLVRLYTALRLTNREKVSPVS